MLNLLSPKPPIRKFDVLSWLSSLFKLNCFSFQNYPICGHSFTTVL
jgi:hypothetical protein